MQIKIKDLQSDDYSSSPEEFFGKLLGDVDTPTLPFGLSNVHQDGDGTDESHLKLSQELNDQLRAQARNFNVSLASLCHLAWAQVLARASGTEIVVFGTVLQLGEESENNSGKLMNILPLRIDIDETSVENAAHRTNSRLNALLMHKNATLELAQRCSGVPNDLPLFSALLNVRHNSQVENIAEPITGTNISVNGKQVNYPLSLTVDDNDNALSITAQVVSPISAIRICSYMQKALVSLAEALATTPQQPVRSLAVIPFKEREMLLQYWNKTAVSYPSERCLHEIFEAHVISNGEAIAVECGEQTLTYAELNRQANQLAHYLIAQGVKPDDRVALCVNRSINILIGILGILKSGGAYVPLDPIYSSQRLKTILQDSNPMFLLTDSTGREALGDHQIPTINLDEALPNNLSVNNPDPIKLGLTSSHLAYVIYTSGSTGTPKGAMVEHRQVINWLHAMEHNCDFTDKDIWCLFHSFSFDFSIYEIGGAWYYGGKLVIAPTEIIRSSSEFYQLICDKGVTVLHHTPAALKAFQSAQSESSQSHSLRWIFFGGESAEPVSLRRWYMAQDKNNLRMINIYGPTETTVAATFWIYDDTIPENATLPIGRPLNNYRIYLLDAFGEVVPLGAEGELYIGGAGVARGYLNRPELTAERFLSDPFREDTMARMYRTGDRARYLPDGNLVFCRRADQQVKIRGFRIEPGEIEARLIEHRLVREAFVQPWKESYDSDCKLVAYVVADPDPLLAQNLRTYLISLLPNYMVPAAYVCLSSFPLTPNGKLDRRALPAPDGDALARQLYEAPQGEMEEKLAAIWSDLLCIENVSRNDNFFALGGHSLLIVRMLSQLQHLGLCTTVREVFDTSSLVALAKTVSHHKSIIIPPNLIPEDCNNITPELLPLINLTQVEIDSIVAQVPGGVSNIKDIYGLAPLQHGILFHHMIAERGDPYLVIDHMKFKNRAVLESYATAMQQVIERHDILRTAFVWEGLSEPAQIVLRNVPSFLTEIALNDSDEPVLQQLCNRFNRRHYKLDLKQPSLLRLIAAPTSDGSWIALQLMHHTIGDHVTVEMLHAEVQAIFNGKSDQLAAPIPFRNVVAQARLGVDQADHTKFFTEMLADVDTPTLPFGLNNVHFDGDDIEEANLKLPQELNDQLRANARKLRVSLASLCHLAWAQVLARASGNETVVFGTVLLGRLQSGDEGENAIGLLMNTLPLRIDIDETSVENAVRYTHSQLSALLMHEHATLALAQCCSGVSSGQPLFSALLNYRHNTETEHVTEPITGIEILRVDERTNYPFYLSVDDNLNEMILTAQVVSSLSAARICAYMQQALVSLVDALANTPKQPVRSLAVIPPEEREMLLQHWNKTAVTYSPTGFLHELFEAQVARNGQAIAVECEGQTMTYVELNHEANKVAHYLIAQGVKPDSRVALCVKRSINMLVGILGILKSGSAYVPLDPVYSSQRLKTILRDSNPICLLTDKNGREALGDHPMPTVNLDEALPASLSIHNPDPIELGLSLTHGDSSH